MTDHLAPSGQRDSALLNAREAEARDVRSNDQRRTEQAHRHRANGRLILGIAIGATLAIGASVYFAQSVGSFSGAGEVVDRQIDTTSTKGQEAAADTARSVGAAARSTGETVSEKMSDVAVEAERR